MKMVDPGWCLHVKATKNDETEQAECSSDEEEEKKEEGEQQEIARWQEKVEILIKVVKIAGTDNRRLAIKRFSGSARLFGQMWMHIVTNVKLRD